MNQKKKKNTKSNVNIESGQEMSPDLGGCNPSKSSVSQKSKSSNKGGC